MRGIPQLRRAPGCGVRRQHRPPCVGAIDGPSPRGAPHLLGRRQRRRSSRDGPDVTWPTSGFRGSASSCRTRGSRWQPVAVTPGPGRSPASWRQLDGPVWLAFHHEPEGDGDLRAWTAMQARLAPIVRETAPNVAYSIILTGGTSSTAVPGVLPGLDLARGHRDRHCRLRRLQQVRHGAHRLPGSLRSATSRMTTSWSSSRFAKESRHRLGHRRDRAYQPSALVEPHWVAAHLHVACSSTAASPSPTSTRSLNSTAPWNLTGEKAEEFARLLKMTPTL